MTEPMNPDVRNRWLVALRSGDYPQGRELLASRTRDANGDAWSYCCLGVLCELAVAAGIITSHDVEEDDYDETNDEYVEADRRYYGGFDTVLPPAVVRWAGLSSDNPVVDGVDLASRNDGREYTAVGDDGRALPKVAPHSFAEVADLIERYL